MTILFVIDGRINTSSSPGGDWGFGLGPVLATLRDRSFAPWVRFEVVVATRDGEQRTNFSPDLSDLFDVPGLWPPSPFDDEEEDPYAGVKFEGFRFTQAGFDLDDYDQVWFFGDWPGEVFDNDEPDDTPIINSDFSPLDPDELKVLAEWMARGGGVFAAGDHGILGASMCHRIPRVRKMRKWTHAQGVPLKNALTRHETLVHDPPEAPDRPFQYPDDEGDPWGQRISPVYRMTSSGPAAWQRAPHPLLCGRDGVIDVFPDHMHEGEVIPDDDVELNDPLDIPGYNGTEFPAQPAVVLGAVGVGAGPEVLDFRRPRPQVIAHGRTTVLGGESERFALVGVYDGEPVGIGRVVVDSTWHHWFSMNTVGFRQEVPHVWRGLQDYYRNVGLWLATPAQRVSMLIASIWDAITSSAPMAFDLGMSPWKVGERVVDVIGRSAPQCLVNELVATFFERDAADTTSVDPRLPAAEPTWSSVPVEVVTRAIAGGIGAGLLDLAIAHGKARSMRKRLPLDADEIRWRGLEGAVRGHELLVAALDEATRGVADVRGRIGSGFRVPEVESIPVHVEALRIRIVLERVRLRAVFGLPEGELPFDVRVRLDGTEVASDAFETGPAERRDDDGPVVDVDRAVATVDVQTGDAMTLEVSLRSEGAPTARAALGGEPADWEGRHVSPAGGPLRISYRVERVDDSAGPAKSS